MIAEIGYPAAQFRCCGTRAFVQLILAARSDMFEIEARKLAAEKADEPTKENDPRAHYRHAKRLAEAVTALTRQDTPTSGAQFAPMTRESAINPERGAKDHEAASSDA